jgi:hypothetical protein
MAQTPTPEWALVYNTPRQPDQLLPQRYSRPEAAVRIALQVVGQFIAQREAQSEDVLGWNKSRQNVVSVSSKRTGTTFFTLRPVLAAGWQGKAAQPAVEAMIQAILDSDLDADLDPGE